MKVIDTDNRDPNTTVLTLKSAVEGVGESAVAVSPIELFQNMLDNVGKLRYQIRPNGDGSYTISFIKMSWTEQVHFDIVINKP